MQPEKSSRIYFLCLLASINFLLISCGEDLKSSRIVYSHDFSDFTVDGWENARFIEFQGMNLLGNYNNEEAILTLDNLPPHNVLEVTVDLMIHDSWDGNPDDGIGGPDIWYFQIADQEVLRTTFSNTPCVSLFCLRQSYPDNYLRQHNPKNGAIQTNLPGYCHKRNENNFTSLYRIKKLIRHNGNSVRVVFGDELVQNNTPFPKCDESWSLAKVEVSALYVK
jgi:hypothetical protein